MKYLFNKLKSNISGDVLIDDFSFGMYSTDASIYQIKAFTEVEPKHFVEVIKAVKKS